MTPSELLSCAPRIAPSKLARIRLLKCKSLGTLVPPGRDGKFLTIALDGKRGPPVRRLPKDVELVEQAEAGAAVRELRGGGDVKV